MGLFEAVFKRGDYREFSNDWIHPTRIVDFNEIIYVMMVLGIDSMIFAEEK